jgi:hypothetical protein
MLKPKIYGKYLRIHISSLGTVADPKLFIPDLKSTFQIMPNLDRASDPIVKRKKKNNRSKQEFQRMYVPYRRFYLANDEFEFNFLGCCEKRRIRSRIHNIRCYTTQNPELIFEKELKAVLPILGQVRCSSVLL